MQSYHITKEGDHWKLAREGSARASLTAETKREIISATSTFMKGKEASVKIHKLDGGVQEERTYVTGSNSRGTSSRASSSRGKKSESRKTKSARRPRRLQ
ncbi:MULTISPECIES: DUF2188 domain-containing protein [unclassified Microbulbifer]|uniref:DUF2188 domain-containing protein n=1 Tax=unclassified Microbulbifer TaxID=2619833 RepID=UPI0027E562B2|nr:MULTISPECIES: DUF2188 domain-containing protein [unclassified Microbulbifer]